MSEYESCCRIILRILLGERKPAVQRKDIERFLAWVMWWWRMTLSNKLVTLPSNIFPCWLFWENKLILCHISSSFSIVTKDVLHQFHPG